MPRIRSLLGLKKEEENGKKMVKENNLHQVTEVIRVMKKTKLTVGKVSLED